MGFSSETLPTEHTQRRHYIYTLHMLQSKPTVVTVQPLRNSSHEYEYMNKNSVVFIKMYRQMLLLTYYKNMNVAKLFTIRAEI